MTRYEPSTGVGAYKLEWLRADTLLIDPQYQREVTNAGLRARKMTEFDPDKMIPLVVSRRASGKCYVIDGHHRLELIKRIGWGDQLVSCAVHEGLTSAQEATIFSGIDQSHKKMGSIELFKSDVHGGVSDALGVLKAVEGRGLVIMKGPGAGHIQAVSALRVVFNSYGPGVLGDMLDTAIYAWGKDSDSFQAPLIHGLAMFLACYPDADRDRLYRVLSKQRPSQVLAAAQQAREVLGGATAHGLVTTAVKAYNRGLSEDKRLDPFVYRPNTKYRRFETETPQGDRVSVKPLSQKDETRIVNRHAAGESLDKITKEYGISKARARAIIKARLGTS